MRYFKLVAVFVSILLVFAESLHAAEYVAFSFKVAQKRIESTPEDQDYRDLHPDVYILGGITATMGLVHDKKTGDAILVGERDPGRSTLTLDDVVVALRARFIYGKWPLVSIDPVPENEITGKQVVRYRGGIEDTQFGKDLFDADFTLKKIGMGLLPSGIPGFKTYRDLNMEGAKEGNSRRIPSRFWLFALPPFVSVLQGLVTIRGLEVRVFAESLLRGTDEDKGENQFGKILSNNYEILAGLYPYFSRLRGLCELIGLSKAIEEMEGAPDLTFFLDEYRVKEIKTKREVKVLKRKEEMRYCESGGVKLIAPTLRPKAGDLNVLREAVLKTRPGADTLKWRFVSGEWSKPIPRGTLERMKEIVPLLTQAAFLEENKRFDAAVVLYGKIIELGPDWSWPYYSRGLACYCGGIYDRAISDYTRALEINPRFFEAYNNRGLAHFRKGLYDQAISDYTQALKINPRHAAAHNNRGAAYHDKGLYDQAISDYTQALKRVPRYAGAYNNRGAAYHDRGRYDRAISDYTEALKINPGDCETYFNKANACEEIGKVKEAIKAYRDFIKCASPKYRLYIEQARERIRKLEREFENGECIVGVRPTHLTRPL